MKTHLDLFSGIGGFALAASWAGYQTVGFCEIEDYPRRILSKRFPGVPIHGDIRELDGSIYRGVDLITGGYPCQPFSQAGQRKGKEDDRHLWPELRRVVAQARPAFLVAENVAGHITLGLDEVLADLESEGYAGRAIVVPACAVNAPHRRDRVWIVAKQLHDADTINNRSAEQERKHKWPEDLGGCSKDKLESRSAVAHSEYKGSQRGVSGGQNPQWEGQHGHTRCCSSSDIQPRENPSIVESRLGGSLDGLSEGLDFPRRWGDGSWEDGIPRVTTKKENRAARLKALGNSILPQVAFQIIKAMKKASNKQHPNF